MATSTINAVFKGGMNFTADVNGHKIEIDTEESRGGKNLGTRPKALMLASLAGCTGLDVVGILKKMRVNFSDLSIKVDAHLTEAEAAIYDEVTVNYSIKVDKEDESKVEKAVKLSQEKYCGVTKMFEAFAKVSYKIHYL
ncbi:MAG TPA: OsmC family protein [Hanamia sp.]|nr:OsmC family protein [Hanamia sp.]